MTLDELRAAIRAICVEASSGFDCGTWGPTEEKRKVARDKISALFRQYRSQFFELAKVPEPPPNDWGYACTPEQIEVSRKSWEGVEKNIKDHDRQSYDFMRSRAIAFFTCSCGSREDSCDEDGEGNFSTFIFTEEGSVFRVVEKKP